MKAYSKPRRIVQKFALLPTLLLVAACSQTQSPRAAAPLDAEGLARQKLVDLFAAHADRFDCASFHYADRTLTATDVRIVPDPGISQDHPSATLSIKRLTLVLAADPVPNHDLRLVSLDAEEPTLRRPESLRTSAAPTETEAFLATYLTDLLNKMSTPRWTPLLAVSPVFAPPTPEAQAAMDDEFGTLRSVNLQTLRMEMPPDRAGATPNAMVISASFTRDDAGGWQANVQAGTQTADHAPKLAPPIHVEFQQQEGRLLARTPLPAGFPDNATASDR